MNWGSLRETYAAALFYETEILEKMNKEKKLFIWDPFCGSGTLLIEAFSIIFQRQARNLDTIMSEGFTKLPFHDKINFKSFLKEENKLAKSYNISIDENFECEFIASDINRKSITAINENCQTAKFKNYKIYSGDKLINKDNKDKDDNSINSKNDYENFVNPIIFHMRVNNVFNNFMGDFEAIGKNVIFSEKNKGKKFTIFSHLPYGVSTHMDDIVKVKKLYKRFGKFLRKFCNEIDDVFIIINKREEKDLLNFKKLSECEWECLMQFENNGISVELLKLKKI
jgi:23S rRNA G2445 N2-methylase RlmL